MGVKLWRALRQLRQACTEAIARYKHHLAAVESGYYALKILVDDALAGRIEIGKIGVRERTRCPFGRDADRIRFAAHGTCLAAEPDSLDIVAEHEQGVGIRSYKVPRDPAEIMDRHQSAPVHMPDQSATPAMKVARAARLAISRRMIAVILRPPDSGKRQ
jgi:hypothetical protein